MTNLRDPKDGWLAIGRLPPCSYGYSLYLHGGLAYAINEHAGEVYQLPLAAIALAREPVDAAA